MRLWNVLRNEWMKLVRRRRLTVVAVLALCLVGLFAFGEYQARQNARNYNPIVAQQNALAELKKQRSAIASEPPSQARDQQLQSIDAAIASVQQQLQEAKQQAQAQVDWRASVKTEMDNIRQELAQIPTGSAALPSEQARRADLQAELTLDQYRLDHDVAPVFRPKLSAWEETLSFLSVADKTFIPLLVVVLVGDMVAGEMTSGTIKLLVVRPVRRRTLLFGKWLVSVAASAVVSFVLCWLFLLAGLAIQGTQGALEPHWLGVTYQFVKSPDDPLNLTAIPNYAHAYLVPAWLCVLYQSLLVALAMAVVATITFFCSTVFKSSMVSTAVAMGAVVIGYVVTEIATARGQGWVRWLFPTHLDLFSDWNGDLVRALQHPVTLGSGILTLLVWAAVLLMLSFIRFGRQDILNA